MIDVKQLWRKRFSLYIKEMRRYLRLIFNDHLKLVLVFAAGGFAYYYQQWIKTLSSDFQSAFVIAIVLAIVLTSSPVRTFLQQPDLVFLLSIETKLKPYFLKSKLYAFGIQTYILLLFIAITVPLYLHQENSNFEKLLPIIICLFIAKAWNILMFWNMQFYTERWVHRSDQIVRLTINFVFVYFLVSHAPLYFPAVIGVLMFSLFLYFQKAVKKRSVKWEHLIDLETKRMMAFYRIANLFTDVPKLKEHVRKRKWLNWLANVAFDQKKTFEYLYLKTFIRSSDYFGIYTRLMIIGSLIIYFLPFYYGKLIVLLLFSYLSGFQLITLYRHHALKIWVDLYPLSNEIKQRSFLSVMNKLMLINSVVLAVVLFVSGEYILGIIGFVVGILFSYGFVFAYVKARLSKMDEV